MANTNDTTTRASAHQRGYGVKWRRAREAFLSRNPLCRLCLAHGQVTPATVVDHIKPHQGDRKLFWSRSNWQSLCGTCHSSHKQSQEKREHPGCDTQGLPLDPEHFWNRETSRE